MEVIGINKTLHYHAFMKDNIGRNVGIDQVVIYFSWLRLVNQNIFIVLRCIVAKMSFARNGSGGGLGLGSSGSGHGAGHRSVENLVESYCKQVVRDIIKEYNENMVVIYAQLSGFGKDLELLQNTMEGLHIDVLSVREKVDNIEIKGSFRGWRFNVHHHY